MFFWVLIVFAKYKSQIYFILKQHNNRNISKSRKKINNCQHGLLSELLSIISIGIMSLAVGYKFYEIFFSTRKKNLTFCKSCTNLFPKFCCKVEQSCPYIFISQRKKKTQQHFTYNLTLRQNHQSHNEYK